MERNTDELRVKGRKRYMVHGSFGTNGTSAPADDSFAGPYISDVTYAATGVYSVVLTDNPGELESGLAGIQIATPADLDVTVVSYTASTKTLVLQVRKTSDGLAVAPPAAAAGNRVHFQCVFSDALSL